MGRPPAAPSPMSPMRGIAIAVAIVLVALLVATASGTRGTYALWNDSLSIAGPVTITSGRPALELSGLAALNFTYTASALETHATVTIENSGNVPLHGFAATMTAESGSADLLDAISIVFTPAGGGASTGIADWLGGLTLAPGAQAQYDAKTTVAAGALSGLANQQVTARLGVTARAGTTWTTVGADQFTQSVGSAVVPPPVDQNLCFTLYGNPAHSMAAMISGLTQGTRYNVFFNDILSGAYLDGWSPRVDINEAALVAAGLSMPPVGETWDFTVTVRAQATPATSGQLIAHGNFTVYHPQGTEQVFSANTVCAASYSALMPQAAPAPDATEDTTPALPPLTAPRPEEVITPDPAPAPETVTDTDTDTEAAAPFGTAPEDGVEHEPADETSAPPIHRLIRRNGGST